MAERYTDFKRRHAGETIYVVGSGATLDYVPRGFFDGKTVVCINRAGEALGLDEFYSVTHYHLDAHILADARPDLPVIVPMVEQGIGYPAKTRPTQANVFFVETNPQMYSAFDTAEHWPTHDDHLVCGPTSLHMGMHFAAYWGRGSLSSRARTAVSSMIGMRSTDTRQATRSRSRCGSSSFRRSRGSCGRWVSVSCR
jgi:hypothetical protein